MRTRHFLVTLMVLVSTAGAAPPAGKPATAPALRDGEAIEVREGDVWSTATLVKREGRKFQIRYDDGTEEWVTADRLRAKGSAAPVAAAKPTTKPTTTRPRVPWMAGQKVETKWGGSWMKSTIVRRHGDWSLVKYETGPGEEWVEPWRIRRVGAKDDDIPSVHPNHGDPKDGPPTPSPAPKPSKDILVSSSAERQRAAMSSDPGSSETSIGAEDGATAIDTSGVRTVDVKSAPAQAPTLQPLATPGLVPQRSTIPLRGATVSSKIVDLAVARGANLAYVGYTEDAKGKRGASVERVDLAAAKSTGLWQIHPKMRLAGASGDGKFFALASADSVGAAREHIELWSSDGPVAKKKFLLTPFDSQKWPDREVAEVYLSGDGTRFAAHNGRGRLIVFDTAEGKPQYVIDVGVFGNFATDASRSYVVVSDDDDLIFVELASGKLLGSVPGGRHSASLALAPDNSRLFTMRGSTISAVDVSGADGSSELTLSSAPSKLLPIDKSLVLVDDTLLLDVDKHAAVWRFEGKPSEAELLPSGHVVFVPNEGRGALAIASLLTPQIKAAAQSAAGEQQVLLKPGSTVSVAYELNCGEDVRQKIIDGSKKALDDAQLKVAEGQNVRIIYHTSPGAATERQYRSFGAAGPSTIEKRTVASQVSRVQIEVAGKPVWTNEWQFNGDVLGMTGKSLDEAIEEGRSRSVASLGSAKLPKYLLAPSETLKVGSSKLGDDKGK